MNPSLCDNALIKSLKRADFLLLAREATVTARKHGEVLFDVGVSYDCTYFPLDGAMLSLRLVFGPTLVAEVATIGCEGAVGIGPNPAVHALPAEQGLPYRCMVQLAGPVAQVSTARLAELAATSPSLATVLSSYAETPVTSYARWQAACTALNPLKRRLATWLLLAHDRQSHSSVTEYRPLPVTQESLAKMLSVRRPSISIVLAELEQDGAVHRWHGALTVTDRSALEAAACGSYPALRRIMGLAPTHDQQRSVERAPDN
jgi:hypothetical protein